MSEAAARAALSSQALELAERELARRRALAQDDGPRKIEAEQSLYAFTRQAWNVLEPATPFIDGWHIGCISEHLEAVTAGQIKRLIINVPPRYMKSLNVSVCWPVWEWGPKRLPHMRYLFSSYGAELVVKHSVDRRTLIESDWYRRNWGKVYQLTSDNNRKTEFENNWRGIMSTTSPSAAATGKGGNRVVIDDPLNPKQALSDLERAAANTHIDQTLYTRLNNKLDDAIVMVMQRLHTADPTGHILNVKKEQGWTHLCLEAEAESRKVITFPMSKREVVREVGDVLWPAREPRETLAETKLALGSYAYAGQYQQRPAPLEGGVIQRAWFKRFTSEQCPQTFDRIIISGDPAFKDYATSSRVALHVWGQVGPNKYLIDRICAHMGFTATITNIKGLLSRWNRPLEALRVEATLIEDKANGPAIIETLCREVSGVIPIEPDGSKVARVLSQSPQMEAGNIWIAAEPWGDEVIDAMCFVPNGDNWDDPDAMSQALKYLRRNETLLDGAAFSAMPEMESANAQW